MLETHELPILLSDPRAQAAKMQFERKPKKCGLSFDRLHISLLDTSISLADIARAAGMSRQALREHVLRYFTPYMGELCARERHAKRVAVARIKRRAVLVEKIQSKDSVAQVLRLAKRDGVTLSIEATTSADNTKFFLINGHRVCVYQVRNIFASDSATKYAHTATSLQVLHKVDFSIYYVAAKGFKECVFILPSPALKLAGHGRTRREMYLPLLPKKHNGRKLLSDYRQFRNDWEQLAPMRGEST